MKKNNVFGIIGIKATDANWNASFDKYPKSLPDGTIMGSDKALKYAIRNYWHLQGEKVFYRKTPKVTDGEIGVLDIKERYEKMFGGVLTKKSSGIEVISNLLSTIDCRQFGYTFVPTDGVNSNATGPVQIGIGHNINPETDFIHQTILSPFRNPNSKGKASENSEAKEGEEKESKTNTFGSTITVDNADYCYPFNIIPKQLDMSSLGIDVYYEEEDFKKFLKASAVCANALNSCSKMGCNNEYVLVVEAKDDSLYLNNLAQYVTYKNGELRLDGLMAYLKRYADRIESIDMYYDSSIISVRDYDNLTAHPLYELENL